MCSKHYQAWVKFGDASMGVKRPRYGSGPEERLRFYGWTVTDSGCWEYNGRLSPKRYGALYDGASTQQVHRVAYRVWVGPIPEGQVVRHKCDNPPCINPDHLETGTQADNVADMIARGRLVVGTGRNSKITEEDVRVIRARRAAGEKVSRIAEDFPISEGTVYAIIRKHKWKHVT